ncbi:Cytochrome P [Trema orientale]|uniref:Cytochrome P n=1 Tax=Trema orientale TaxID=63057 RepID=A0A2P5BBS8_TREOI|nr:Cytochrome P [Trema orientale]
MNVTKDGSTCVLFLEPSYSQGKQSTPKLGQETKKSTKWWSTWPKTCKERRSKLDMIAFGAVQNMLGYILVSKDIVEHVHETLRGELCELMNKITDVASSPNISDFYPIYFGSFGSSESTKEVHGIIVQEELAREIRGDVVKESDLPKLKCLQACLKEILRVTPDLGQYVSDIGRDPGLWEEYPLVFKPERFVNSSLDFKGNDFQYFPFGSGRRICPGMPMAARQIALVVASLIHSFDWSLPQGMDLNDINMTEKYGIAMRMEQSLILEFLELSLYLDYLYSIVLVN